jgi:hypothetical protein
MAKSSLDSARLALDEAGGPTGRRVNENALRRDGIRVEAPERALEAATSRSGTGTIRPPSGAPGGAMGR